MIKSIRKCCAYISPNQSQLSIRYNNLYTFKIDGHFNPIISNSKLSPLVDKILKNVKNITQDEAYAVFKILKLNNNKIQELDYRNTIIALEILENLEQSQSDQFQEFMMYFCESMIIKVITFRNYIPLEKIEIFEEGILKRKKELCRQKHDKCYHIYNFLSFKSGTLQSNRRERIRLMFMKLLYKNPFLRDSEGNILDIFLDFQQEIEKIKLIFFAFGDLQMRKGIINNLLLFYNCSYMKFIEPGYDQFVNEFIEFSTRSFKDNPRGFYCYFYQNLQLFKTELVQQFHEKQFFEIVANVLLPETSELKKNSGFCVLFFYVPSLLKKGIKISRSIIYLMYQSFNNQTLQKVINESLEIVIKENIQILLAEIKNQDLIEIYVKAITQIVDDNPQYFLHQSMNYNILFENLNDKQLAQILLPIKERNNQQSLDKLKNLKNKLQLKQLISYEDVRNMNFRIDTKFLDTSQSKYFLQTIKTEAIIKHIKKDIYAYYVDFDHEQTLENLQKELKFISQISYLNEKIKSFYLLMSKNDLFTFYLGYKIFIRKQNDYNTVKTANQYFQSIFYISNFPNNNNKQQGEQMTDVQRFIVDDWCDNFLDSKFGQNKRLISSILFILDYYNLLSFEPTEKLFICLDYYLSYFHDKKTLDESDAKAIQVVVQCLKQYNRLTPIQEKEFKDYLDKSQQQSQENMTLQKFYEETQHKDQEIEFI